MIPLYQVHMPESAAERVREVLYSGRLADGPLVRRFEESFGSWLGNPLVTSHDNVSSALLLALYAAGVRPGDKVVASPMACLATNQPALNLFAEVVWADVVPDTGNIDAVDVARVAQDVGGVKALLYPHWAGDPANVDALLDVARRYGLAVIEDAGEALGAESGGRRVGSLGADFTVFAFHAIRHITTGEGAAIAYRDPEAAARTRRLRRYGIDQSRFRDADGEIDPACDVPEAGYNFYMTSLAAALGLEQLAALPGLLARHQANGRFLDAALAGVAGLEPVRRHAGDASAYWVYTVLADRRDDLLRSLRSRGVYASKVHLRNDLYSCFGPRRRELPGLDAFSARYLCLPCGWWVGDADRERIVAAVKAGW